MDIGFSEFRPIQSLAVFPFKCLERGTSAQEPALAYRHQWPSFTNKSLGRYRLTAVQLSERTERLYVNSQQVCVTHNTLSAGFSIRRDTIGGNLWSLHSCLRAMNYLYVLPS